MTQQSESISSREASIIYNIPRSTVCSWIARGKVKVNGYVTTKYGRQMALMDLECFKKVADAWYESVGRNRDAPIKEYKTVRLREEVYRRAREQAYSEGIPLTLFVEVAVKGALGEYS